MKGSNEVELEVAAGAAPAPTSEQARDREVSIEIDRRSYTFVGVPVIVNINLKNNAEYPLRNINFLEHIPEQMNVSRLPDPIRGLEVGKSITSSVELSISIEGVYRVSPIELYYEDPSGTRYVKGSNEMTIEVVEKPPTDFKNYMNAIAIYEKYAKNQAENKNFFEAGNGYREMAEIYSKFRTDEKLDEFYDSSIKHYRMHLTENKEPSEQDIGKLKRWGDAHWHIGEAFAATGRHIDSAGEYRDSGVIYGKCGFDHLVHRSNALAARMEAIKAIRSGDYDAAQAKIKESMDAFNKAAEMSQGFEKDELQRLFKDEADTKSLLDGIRSKPEIKVAVDGPDDVDVGVPFKMRAKVKNPLSYGIKAVKPLIKTVDGVEIEKTIHDVFEVGPGEELELEFELVIKRQGTFRFHPIEITYLDQNANAYRRGVDEVRITAAGAPETQPTAAPQALGAAGTPQTAQAPADAEQKEEESGSPQVSLRFKDFVGAQPGEVIDVKGVLENAGSSDAFGLRFIGNSIDGIQILETPEAMNGLPGGTKQDVIAKVKLERKGMFDEKLIEMFYKNTKGKRFFKSSEPVTITSEGYVAPVEKASEDELPKGAKENVAKELLEAKGDTIALISTDSEDRWEVVTQAMKSLINEKGMGCVYITLSQPTETVINNLAEAGIKMDDLYFIDCISRMTGKSMEKSEKITYIENPSSLEEVSLFLERMLGKVETEKKFLFLDSLSSLLIYNTEKTVKEFTHFIINRTRLMGISAVILSIKKKEVEELVKTLTPICDLKILL